jgi:hypothetical protein
MSILPLHFSYLLAKAGALQAAGLSPHQNTPAPLPPLPGELDGVDEGG